jgi:hypothetical protein
MDIKVVDLGKASQQTQGDTHFGTGDFLIDPQTYKLP